MDIRDLYNIPKHFCAFSMPLGHRQEQPAVPEQLAQAQQAARAFVRPSARRSSALQSRLWPCSFHVETYLRCC